MAITSLGSSKGHRDSPSFIGSKAATCAGTKGPVTGVIQSKATVQVSASSGMYPAKKVANLADRHGNKIFHFPKASHPLSVGRFVGVFIGAFVGACSVYVSIVVMVHVSKIALQCPATSCDFAYFARTPDPSARLRNHFNNLKKRDSEHEAFFQNPICLFCGKKIQSKSRKGLWKRDMNKHWIIDHANEFVEDIRDTGQEEIVSKAHLEHTVTN